MEWKPRPSKLPWTQSDPTQRRLSKEDEEWELVEDQHNEHHQQYHCKMCWQDLTARFKNDDGEGGSLCNGRWAYTQILLMQKSYTY